MGDNILYVISKQAQEYYKTTPVIILGSGASAAYGMAGMWELSQHLIKTVPKSDLSPAELLAWEAFCKLLSRPEYGLHLSPQHVQNLKRQAN